MVSRLRCGAVYGLLSGNGTRLYMADGINGREYGVEAIADGYGYRPIAGEWKC